MTGSTMPEGDTIFRTAATLQKALAGKTVTRFETVLPRLARVDDQTPLRGRTVERVVANGKHLIIDFSGGLHLRSHMKMNGSWHVYRAGERWRRPRRDMRVVLETAEYVAIGFNLPVAELLTSAELARNAELRALGPDILAEDFDVAEAVRRLRTLPDEEIGNALLNQRALAGIGNIWKSEALFATGVHPFRRVQDLDDAALTAIVDAARRLMRASAVEGRAPRAVYSRGGELCRKCGAPIECRKQGPDARGTYWCRRCQP
jgi:endonuclease-8